MDMFEQIDKNSINYIEYLDTIKKDVERIMIYISYHDSHIKHILLSKLEQLEKLISSKIRSKSTNYQNDNIIITKDYVILNLFEQKNIVEINKNSDIEIDVENIILLKRNMKEFYFYSRGVLFLLDEGDFVANKIEYNWENDFYKIENRKIYNEEKDININELIKQKVYLKGSKK